MERPILSPSHAPDRPDAVKWPHPAHGEGVVTAADIPGDAKEQAVELAERHLQCGPHELAWVRDQSGLYYYATRNNGDDPEFNEDKSPRYRWVDVGEGVQIGWLIGG